MPTDPQHRYEFRADWFTAEDAADRRFPHEMAGTVEAATIRDAIAAAEAIASPGEAVEVRSVWMLAPAGPIPATNEACPSWHAHYDNAAERLYPGAAVLSPDADAAVVAAADAEWAACEGHGR